MFDVNAIPSREKKRIISTLQRWGIVIDDKTGRIDYIKDFVVPKINASAIYLIRHAETIAVEKHEFMSDTSANCAFTEKGVEITKKQAEALSDYNFDIAFYGPIKRVVDTKIIVMQRPQMFRAIKLNKLHGIDNTGWEYKSYFDLENDPIFLAREVELNMFARTPRGSSWGTVIANCADVLEYINKKCVGKRVLLISQGSVLRGMEILLRAREHPWDDYSASGMYHVGDDSQKKKNYGVISKVY